MDPLVLPSQKEPDIAGIFRWYSSEEEGVPNQVVQTSEKSSYTSGVFVWYSSEEKGVPNQVFLLLAQIFTMLKPLDVSLKATIKKWWLHSRAPQDEIIKIYNREFYKTTLSISPGTISKKI